MDADTLLDSQQTCAAACPEAAWKMPLASFRRRWATHCERGQQTACRKNKTLHQLLELLEQHCSWELLSMCHASLGGLGLLCVQCTAPAADAWADALSVMRARAPDFARRCRDGRDALDGEAETPIVCARRCARCGSTRDSDLEQPP